MIYITCVRPDLGTAKRIIVAKEFFLKDSLKAAKEGNLED